MPDTEEALKSTISLPAWFLLQLCKADEMQPTLEPASGPQHAGCGTHFGEPLMELSPGPALEGRDSQTEEAGEAGELALCRELMR